MSEGEFWTGTGSAFEAKYEAKYGTGTDSAFEAKYGTGTVSAFEAKYGTSTDSEPEVRDRHLLRRQKYRTGTESEPDLRRCPRLSFSPAPVCSTRHPLRSSPPCDHSTCPAPATFTAYRSA